MSALGQKRTFVLGVLCHLSYWCTARRFPKLSRGPRPIEGVISRTVLLQMFEPAHRVLDAWSAAGRHPPHYEILLLEVLEPFDTSAVKPLVDGLVDKMFKRVHALPHRQIDSYAGIGVRPRASRVAAFVDIAPNEAGCPLGEPVHQRQIVREVRHARILDLVANAPNVQLREMMIRWLLQRVLLRYRIGSNQDTGGGQTLNQGLIRFSSAVFDIGLRNELHFVLQRSCPVYPRKQTCATQSRMSAKGQKQTFL